MFIKLLLKLKQYWSSEPPNRKIDYGMVGRLNAI